MYQKETEAVEGEELIEVKADVRIQEAEEKEMIKLGLLRAGLSALERRLLACLPKSLPLSDKELLLDQYALGKIELFNLWGLEAQDPERAYLEAISYCHSYVKIYEELERDL